MAEKIIPTPYRADVILRVPGQVRWEWIEQLDQLRCVVEGKQVPFLVMDLNLELRRAAFSYAADEDARSIAVRVALAEEASRQTDLANGGVK